MGAAAHLGIALSEYDARIRSFIPDYEAMIDAAASVIPPRARRIVDLGTGTGALAARCLTRAPDARVVGVDEDTAMLAMARRRLRGRGTFVTGSFLEVPLPPCEAVVASFSLHHIRTQRAKGRLYRRIREALAPGGRLVIVDCLPASDPALARGQFERWTAHLRRRYSAATARRLRRAWAREDTYVPLDEEVALVAAAGFRVETIWRQGAFAVLMGRAGPVVRARRDLHR